MVLLYVRFWVRGIRLKVVWKNSIFSEGHFLQFSDGTFTDWDVPLYTTLLK